MEVLNSQYKTSFIISLKLLSGFSRCLLIICLQQVSMIYADIQEAKDMLFFKSGSMMNMPSYRSKAMKVQFPFATWCTKGSISFKMDLSQHADDSSSGSNKIFENSMLPIPALLSSFPFMSKISCVDIFNVFHFERMHCLSLGISKPLKSAWI